MGDLHREFEDMRYDSCPSGFPVVKEFYHQFIPSMQSRRTLFLLHGTGGDENEILPLGHALEPGAAMLSVRGRVSENGANRYFRRRREGVFDEDDVVARAHELAEWLAGAVDQYAIYRSEIVLIGYSNGANIGSAMMLLGVEKFPAAILLRPMVPLSAPPLNSLESSRVLLLGGTNDPIAPPAEVNRLALLFQERNAHVTNSPQRAGHEISGNDVQAARDWLAGVAFA